MQGAALVALPARMDGTSIEYWVLGMGRYCAVYKYFFFFVMVATWTVNAHDSYYIINPPNAPNPPNPDAIT